MSETRHGNALENGLKLVGEAFLPGASLLLDGNVKGGAGHALAGLAARLLLGPIGAVVVAANSFSTSVTGDSLLQSVRSPKAKDAPQA